MFSGERMSSITKVAVSQQSLKLELNRTAYLRETTSLKYPPTRLFERMDFKNLLASLLRRGPRP